MTRRFSSLHCTALLLALGSVLLLASCREDVTAVVGTDRPFSLYGVLNPEQDTQWVRVFEIREQLQPLSPAPLDARVTSTNLATGQTRTWQDSTLHFENGTYGHVYWAPFQAAYEQAYRLEVHRSDKEESRAQARVPSRVTSILGDPRLVTTGEDAGVLLPMLLKGTVSRLYRPEAEYLVRYGNFGTDVTTVSLSYRGEPEQTNEGWLFTANLSEDYRDILLRLSSRDLYDNTCGIKLLRVSLHVRIVNEEWALPGFITNPNEVVQPGVFSNVENGFGFLGAGYHEQVQWIPKGDILETAPFIGPGEAFPDGCPAPAGPPSAISSFPS